MPLQKLHLQNTNRPIDVIMHWRKEGYLLLDPPYQRGEVWGPIRQKNLIRSLLSGVPIPSIVINDRHAANWENDIQYSVIDGKQRCIAFIQFIEGDLLVPGEWVGIDDQFARFPDLEIPKQRAIKNMPIGVCEGRLESLEQEREVFELINFGGVPYGETDV